MYHLSVQGVDERLINVHYYYYCHGGRRSVAIDIVIIGILWSI